MITLDEAMDLLASEKPKPIKPKKYRAIAYLERCLRSAIDGIDTDNESDLIDFVWENCQQGLVCEVFYNETGKRMAFYAEDLTEKSPSINDLLGDLQLEQKEEM